MMKLFSVALLIAAFAATATVTAQPAADPDPDPVIITGESSRSGQRLNTKTVYGFLDFTTTVRDTVMIFKPSKADGSTPSILRNRPAKIPAIQASKKAQLKVVATASPTTKSADVPEIESSIAEDTEQTEGAQESRVILPNDSAKKDVGSVKLPKDVEVRTSMKIAPDSSSSVPVASQMPDGQTLISSTTGTLVKNGVTTVYETSVIGTTIEGQYAQFVKSTSRVLEDASVEPTVVVGSVEAVTKMPKVKSLPQVDESEKESDQLSEPSIHHSSVQLEPSFQFTTGDEDATEGLSETTTAVTERINGLISSQRRRNDDNRWRYNPSPKPKVTILRNSGAKRFRSGGKQDLSVTPQAESEDVDPTEVITLRVSTVTADGYSNWFYEVATIKSPYVMRLGAIKNTRYVTMTKSYTRRITATESPSSSLTSSLPSSLLVAPSISNYETELALQSKAIEERFDEESIPDLPLAENILATTTPVESILKDSSDTATLPAIIVAATESESLSLETITESFSTTETRKKTSILPYLRGGETSLLTLTQTYSITRVVVAVKTLPPLHLYQFIPSKTLTDISTRLQEAGSEHRERLLEGELEFSDNEELSSEEDDGPIEERLPVPADFLDSDLSSIGTDFDLASMDKQIDLQPSLVSSVEATEGEHFHKTPSLPHHNWTPSSGGDASNFNSKPETQVLSPEQLQQLALLRYINPYAAAGLPFGYGGLPGGMGAFGPMNGVAGDPGAIQVIQTSRPVVRNDGVTETEYGTTTLNANPLFGQQFTVVSSPVVNQVTTTSTQLRVYRIIFRAQTTFTTVTSTSVFPTMVTSYVSSTVPVQPTRFPGSLFGYPTFG